MTRIYRRHQDEFTEETGVVKLTTSVDQGGEECEQMAFLFDLLVREERRILKKLGRLK